MCCLPSVSSNPLRAFQEITQAVRKAAQASRLDALEGVQVGRPRKQDSAGDKKKKGSKEAKETVGGRIWPQADSRVVLQFLRFTTE